MNLRRPIPYLSNHGNQFLASLDGIAGEGGQGMRPSVRMFVIVYPMLRIHHSQHMTQTIADVVSNKATSPHRSGENSAGFNIVVSKVTANSAISAMPFLHSFAPRDARRLCSMARNPQNPASRRPSISPPCFQTS